MVLKVLTMIFLNLMGILLAGPSTLTEAFSQQINPSNGQIGTQLNRLETQSISETDLLWGPYLTTVTSSNIMVNARTSETALVTIEYAAEDYYKANSSYDLTAKDDDPSIMHHVPISGLRPDTVYHYRLVCGLTITQDYNWRTLPVRGKFTFAVISDTQDELPRVNQYDRYKLVADAISVDPEVAFVVHCGDLVNDGTSLNDWNRYFDVSRKLMANTAVFTTLGNHEENDPLYYEAFGYPAYYSFDCSEAQFTILDSVYLSDDAAQTSWLTNNLSKEKNWKFVFSHYPVYTSDPNHFGGWENLKSAWEGIFIQKGVDAVWNGHIHAYERYLEKGVNYIGIGTGGGPSMQLNTDKFAGHCSSLENSLAYARVTVDPGSSSTTVQIIRVADISIDNKQVTRIYPLNNIYETITLSKSGTAGRDFNRDGVCDAEDILALESCWGQSGDPGWIPEDINHDGIVNLCDLVSLGLHWNEKG
jgi:predicted phosphodiesterase